MQADWSDFKVLLALADAGSVAGAARELQVDHSTVSRRLAALETAVGATLVIRGGRELRFTDEGRALLSAARTMAEAAARATRSVHSAKAEIEGRVRVSVSPGFVPLLVRLVLPGLRERHPGLDVELRGDYHRADLARGEADIAVRMARPEEPDLIGRHGVECSWFAYASPAYLAAQGRPASPADLARHRLVLYVEPMHAVAPCRWMEAWAGAGTKHLRVDNLEVAANTAIADAGIAVLPCLVAGHMPGLERVFDQRVAFNAAWIVYHESVRDAARVRAVVEALGGFFEAHASIFTGEPASAG